MKVKKIMVLNFSKLSFKLVSAYMLPQSSDICFMLNKNTWGVEKCEANQKQHASRQVQPTALISPEAKKLLYQKTFNSLMTYNSL